MRGIIESFEGFNEYMNIKRREIQCSSLRAGLFCRSPRLTSSLPPHTPFPFLYFITAPLPAAFLPWWCPMPLLHAAAAAAAAAACHCSMSCCFHAAAFMVLYAMLLPLPLCSMVLYAMPLLPLPLLHIMLLPLPLLRTVPFHAVYMLRAHIALAWTTQVGMHPTTRGVRIPQRITSMLLGAGRYYS
eukprot:848845-Pelagomonas_calceolata.AAC.3